MRLLIFLGLAAAVSHACSCMSSPTGNPPCQAVWQYQAVFTGVVTDIDNPGIPVYQPGMPPPSFENYPRQKVFLRVTRALSGFPTETREMMIETGLGGGDCGYLFQRGVEYIIYAHRQPKGGLGTGICSPTRPVEDAADDLKYFQQLVDAKPGGEIRVSAFDPHRTFRPGQKASLSGLPGAQISIAGNGLQKAAKTDLNGRVVFSDIPAGEYTVVASLSGYVVQNELRLVKLHDKGCAEVPVSLQMDRIISGRVITNDGVPASGILVEAVRARPLHENDLPQAIELAETDSFGQYKLQSLTTGDYYIGISLTRSPRAEAPYTRWFYPGTEDPASAALVHVADGPEAQTIDLRLPPRQNARNIQGVVLWPDGAPASNVQITLEDPRWPRDIFNVASTTDSNGRFTASVLDGTRYRVHAIGRRAAESFTGDPVAVEPGSTPANVRLVLSRKGFLKPQDDQALKAWRSGQGLR
jgi:5-hydroxyisourate hydrolase-like protein (transthyretin family)